MYFVKKSFQFSAAHCLKLDYTSRCSGLHGHNWKVTVECRSEELDRNGMVIDFTQIKALVIDKVDHRVLNDVFDFNPTAENIARWIVETVPHCYRCTVEESENNIAIFEKDDA